MLDQTKRHCPPLKIEERKMSHLASSGIKVITSCVPAGISRYIFFFFSLKLLINLFHLCPMQSVLLNMAVTEQKPVPSHTVSSQHLEMGATAGRATFALYVANVGLVPRTP